MSLHPPIYNVGKCRREKFLKTFEKPLDIHHIVWYNVDTAMLNKHNKSKKED